jgi:Phycobilisome degradation protein nblA
METTVGLSFEQEFMLRVFEEQVKNLSLQETQEYLLKILHQSMVKENLFKDMLKNNT